MTLTYGYARSYGTAEARNLIAHGFRAMPTRPTHLLQLDSDIEFPSELVVRMLQRNVDIIGAPCRLKLPDREGYAVELMNGSLTVERGAFKAKAVGTAVLLTTRAAIERVAAISEKYEFGEHQDVAGIFDDLLVEGHRLKDDFAFCHRARSVGLDVWGMFDAKTVHHGPGPGWRGDFRAAVTREAAAKQRTGT